MSLITPSYFIGPLTIAQLGQPSVNNDLITQINLYEPELLIAALGYELYDDFSSGLAASVIDQKWIDLRDGIVFNLTTNFPGWFPSYFYNFWRMNQTRKVKWVGFSSSSNFTQDSNTDDPLVFIAGSGAGNPVSGTNTFTSTKLAGAKFTIERRGFGTMIRDTDYSLSNNNQTITLLKAGDKFNPNEIFIIHFTKVVNAGTPSGSGISPLAGYVYFKYMRNLITQASGSGIVKSDAQNATTSVSDLKMRDAWNQMIDNLAILWFFLAAQGTNVYASYNYLNIDFVKFQKINMFNL